MPEKQEVSSFQSPLILVDICATTKQMTGVYSMSQLFFIDSMNCDKNDLSTCLFENIFFIFNVL